METTRSTETGQDEKQAQKAATPDAAPVSEQATEDISQDALESELSASESTSQISTSESPEDIANTPSEEDEENAMELMEASLNEVTRPKDFQVGQKISGKIIELQSENAFLDIGQKSEASISIVDLRGEDGTLPEVGDEIEAYIINITNSGVELGKTLSAGEDAMMALEEAYSNQVPVEGKVTARNKGGLEVEVYNKRAFCPASHIEVRFCENPEQYVGQTLTFKIIELKENGRKIVVSRRLILEEALKEKADAIRAQLEEGAEFDGTVTSLAEYGAFVSIGGGLEGLVHVSEISHSHVGLPKEALQRGQQVRVRVLKYSPSDNRISLSMKALESDPWESALERFPEGAVVKGKVVRIEKFGAFVQLAPGIDGLIHISELSYKRVKHPSEVVSPGEERELKVIRNEPEKRRIGLSIKGLEEAPIVVDNSVQIKEGAVYTGKVENAESFGVFVLLPNGRKGLVPNNEMGTPRHSDHAKMFPGGTEMEVKVLRIDDSGKIRLSRKAVIDGREKAEEMQNIKSFKQKQGGDRVFGTLGDLFKNLK